jgi:hypothetical protein
VYFNIAGILYMMIHSIILRRNLVKMAFEIDSVSASPSDFALLVRKIPHDMSKTQLITAIEKHFLKLKLTVSYVNLCYNIEEMVLLN